MNSYSSSNSSLPFTSKNHGSHDDSWLLPGISTSYFCFACAIEGLQDSSTLSIRKKKIVSELLEMLVVNQNVGKMITNKQDVYFHLLELYVSLLDANSDEELSELIHQCCVHTIQQTDPLHAATIVIDNLIQTKRFAENGFLLKLACVLLETYPSICGEFSKKNSVYIDQIVQSTTTSGVDSCCNNAVTSWHLLSLLLEAGVSENEMKIPRDIVEHILVGGLNCIATSWGSGMEIHIINSIKSLAQSNDFRSVIFEHESSKLTTKDQSIVDVLKKMLLSTREELEIAALHCVSVICNSKYETENEDLTSLVSLVLEKGLSEFLFEMLSTTGEEVIGELFQCLQKLTSCEKFSSMGHMVYGFSAIVKATSKMEKCANIEAFYQGVVLIEAMLNQKGVFSNHLNHLTKQGPRILEILICGFDKPMTRLKYACIGCFCVYIKLSPGLILADWSSCSLFLETVYKYIEKDVSVVGKNVDEALIDFVVKGYTIVHLMACILSEQVEKSERISSTDEEISSSGLTPSTQSSSDSSQLSSQQQAVDNEVLAGIINDVYYLTDEYLIPVASKELIESKNLDLQRIFFITLLAVIELSESSGQLVATKAARNSFIKVTYDFKVFASLSTKDLDMVLGKLLLHFCSAIDNYLLNDWVHECLTKWFAKFNLPFNEWKFMLTKGDLVGVSSSVQLGSEYLAETRSCILTLLVYSHIAGAPMMTLAALRSHLISFVQDKESVFMLPILGKRYLLYLWSHLTCMFPDDASNEQANQNVVKMVESEIERIDVLYMNADLILVWMLRNEISKVVLFCLQFFQDIVISEAQLEEDTPGPMESLLLTLCDHGVVRKFLEILVTCISSCDNELAAAQLTTIFASSLQPTSSSDIAYFKGMIHKTFMMDCNKMDSYHFSFLIRCACHLEAMDNSRGGELHDEDLKLFCKCLTLLSEPSTPTLKFQLVNYINIVMTKSVRLYDGKSSSLLLAQHGILTEFEQYLFTNDNLIANSKCSYILEKINAAIILVVTQLLSGSRLLGEFSTRPIKINLNVLIEGLVCPTLPVLHVALLVFWKEMFALKFHSPLVQFVDVSTGKESVVTKNFVRQLYATLQNLLYDERDLIRELAAECIDSLLQHLNQPDFLLDQSWTRKLIEIAIHKLSEGEPDLPSIKFIYSFVKHADRCQADIFDVTVIMLKRCVDFETIDFETAVGIIELSEVVIKSNVESIEYTVLKELKELLKSIHRKCCRESVGEEDLWKYTDVEELLLVSPLVSSSLVLETLRRTKNFVCERINSIDDETDSGDDGVYTSFNVSGLPPIA